MDPKPALERVGHPLAYYFATDPHWNASGQDLAAQELFQAILQRGLRTDSATVGNLVAQPKLLP